MNLHAETQPSLGQHQIATTFSPVASDRVRSLALRAIEGAPALTAGEMRELAEAILDHNVRSEQET